MTWKTLNSKIVHKNPWWQVKHNKVINLSGKPDDYFIVDKGIGVLVVAEYSDKEIVLVGQTRYPIGNIYSWEVIGGGAKSDQTPLAAAKAELTEEAGFKAKKWIKIGYSYSNNSISSEKIYMFLARDLKKVQVDPEDSEDITVRIESVENVKEMIKKNVITDGRTITVMYKYLEYINR